MIPVSAYAGARVGVLGLGRSGLATARALAAGGAEPVLWDDGEAARGRAAEAGFAVEDLARERAAAGLAALIVSPGIAHLYPAPHPAIALAQAAGVPVDNEIGLFFAALEAAKLDFDEGPEPKVVAITGSNGKSTTTALLRHILAAARRPVQMGGNIGRAALDLDPPGPGETVVLELSSYQTELARALAPDIAVFLNLAPDHLDRHGGIGGYFAAKRRLFEAGAPARAIIGIDEPEGRFLASLIPPEDLIAISASRRLRGEGWPDWRVFMNRSHLTEWRGGRQVAAIDMRACPGLLGAHNHQNAAAAYAAARALGLGPKAIEAGLASFPGLAHRMERLGASPSGVIWVNDSKATNAAATARALAAFEGVHLILGGRAKEDGIAALAPLFPRIAHAYLIGEAAERFAAELGETPQTRCGTLQAAVAAAAAAAAPGAVVLLSPAAASFDQFADFEARGDAFRALAAPHLAPPDAAPRDDREETAR
ncbi:UDP-N-acetylmuramoyl-L-alanine--D-glutamate ligase [Paralimibaculum aggregatum]|uniref:UDP-N-acetylmuramoylalanine--D-glutamate ligase n=1 Tax=Paralimibaculum aggregatum TaxID=3036245 RepID=A0ABQ6LKZ4_9RHOB|nr:UDP-N-acetylmuramoyl-L-alanine--D-glutamate ligase [Limibaculum sp. NKW23]GMG82342.1 UDP-N-acetylmuramoyl-L-alanine--D-glutamate ligase [Limibaculum sp. NKW23]